MKSNERLLTNEFTDIIECSLVEHSLLVIKGGRFAKTPTDIISILDILKQIVPFKSAAIFLLESTVTTDRKS